MEFNNIMSNIRYLKIQQSGRGFYIFTTILISLVLLALVSVFYMEHNGHFVTGMNNRIVWGMPHIFAIFLIVAASGALNIASIASVFKKELYKPLARLSTVLSIILLAGGLMVLVLDLGRPDRLIIAMTRYNFHSIFAWNIILYNGFFVIVGIYAWMMLERKMNKYSTIVGKFAFIWRLILTTGTGSIFGFLVARQAYDAVIMGPMFVIMSFAFGLAIYLLILIAFYKWSNRELGNIITNRLSNLLGIFVAAIFYFVAIYHLGNLYLAENNGVESFILFNGGIYTKIFWYGQVILGLIIPLLLIYCPRTRNKISTLSLASVLIIIGGMAQLYVIIIGGQAYPMEIFVGKEILTGYGEIVVYNSSFFEILLGVGSFAFVVLIAIYAVKLLPLLPENLSNKLFK